jgi:hypothetical protein
MDFGARTAPNNDLRLLKRISIKNGRYTKFLSLDDFIAGRDSYTFFVTEIRPCGLIPMALAQLFQN